MRDGHYLRTRFHSGYHSEGYVYERDLWLKKGLVLTDDNRALFRNTAFYIFEGTQPDAVVDGEPLYTGPGPDFLPDEPLPWFPFCVDGRWGYGDCNTGEVMVQPQWAFCDHFFEHCARFSAKGDFSDLDKECYDGAWGLYDGGYGDGRWGVLSCPRAEIAVEPTLSREKAEKEFWALEGSNEKEFWALEGSNEEDN